MEPKDDSLRGCEAFEVGTGQQATQLLAVDGGDEDELKIITDFLSPNMSCSLLLSHKSLIS